MSANFIPEEEPRSALQALYPDDGYFAQPELGDWYGSGLAELGTGFVANELLGIDDFRRALGLGGAGAPDLSFGERMRAGATGLTELGLTVGSIVGAIPSGGTTVAARLAAAGVKATPQALKTVINAVPLVGHLARFVAKYPLGATRAAGALRTGLGWLGRQGDGTTAEVEAADGGTVPPFVMNLPERGTTGVAAVPGLDLSFMNRYRDTSGLETILANQVAQIEGRAGAYDQAIGAEFTRVRAVNVAAAVKAIDQAVAAGTEGAGVWERAALGALDVTEARNAALTQMGGMPQTIAPGGSVEDFERFAAAAGASEENLQRTLGNARAEDYRYAAGVADQTGAAFQGEIARAEQDAIGAAVAEHNRNILERENMLMQMEFQAALQNQQLGAQAAIANARSGDVGDIGEVLGVAVELANRPGSQGGQVLQQLFPGVFPSAADAQGFIDSLGTANPFGS